MGRRPVKVKTLKRYHSRFFDALGLRSRVDVVAQQVLDHEAGIFKAVKENDVTLALALIEADGGKCLTLRDSVGASPLHVAFLFGHHELGKQLVLTRKDLATLTYSTLETSGEISPYEGENVLHIAIVQRAYKLAKWLVTHVPDLLNAEAVGKFFRPGKTCYFGGTPLLFALASNQIDVALDVLEAADKLKKLPKHHRRQRTLAAQQLKQQQRALFQQLDPHAFAKHVQKIVPVAVSVATGNTSGDQGHGCGNDDDFDDDDEPLATTIFMTDSFGNNALHLAVIHDLPNVFDFAVQFAMLVLANPGFCVADIDTAASTISSPVRNDTITAIGSSSSAPASPHTDTETDADADALEEQQRRARVASFSRSCESSSSSSTLTREPLVDFLRRVDDTTHDTMLHGFLMQRNRDNLSPLSLAAALGNTRMFQHILQQLTAVSWSYGPITALNIPLLDLEEPVAKPDSTHRGRLQFLRKLLSSLPYPLAPPGRHEYKTAIQCLCSLEPLSTTIPKAELPVVLENRLEMLKLIQVRQLLAKKWKYVGKQRFMARLWLYALFLLTFNVSTLMPTAAYRDNSTQLWQRVVLAVCELVCYTLAVLKFVNEFHQVLFNFRSYVTEAGAGRLDNICTMLTCIFLFSAGATRLAIPSNGNSDDSVHQLHDAFTAIALVFAWFYTFFFLLGFRTTGPFVIMILNMIQNDVVRFAVVYASVLAGFSQALYLVADGREGGLHTLLHRGRVLLIAGFTGEINYNDNYTSGRMNALTQVLMVAYIVLVMILLVNLLIAMMGNTYAEILAKSEQRWVAERANIMATIENQCSVESNHHARRKYAIPLAAQRQKGHGSKSTSRRPKEDMFLQIEINNMDTWKTGQRED